MKLLPATFWAIVTVLVGHVRCDYYASIASLSELLKAEAQVLEFFETYLQNMERLHQRINKTLDEMEKFVKEAEEDPEDYFENPLNAFKIISRLVIDWGQLKRVVFDDTYAQEYAKNISDMVKNEEFEMPTEEDLVGASKGLVRLQRTYAQDTEDVAEGDLMEINFGPPFTASDCYHLGRSLYLGSEFRYAAEWLMEARIRLAKELQASNKTYGFPFVTDVQILNYLAPSMFNIGNSKLALVFNEQLLTLDPDIQYGKDNSLLYEDKVREERRVTYIEDIKPAAEPPRVQKWDIDDLFVKTCRGELKQTPRQQRNLRCRYAHNNVPFCLLAPFKMEELNLDPPISYYHDSIYESEMQNIINATEDYLERSQVGELDETTYSDERTSHNTWLDLNGNDFLKNIAQRLKDITSLTLYSAEALQVANYGIGGHYGAHFDSSEDPNDTFRGRGNRLLTALFYINEVKLGGGTAFPLLNLLAAPIKGSMVMWYNLHKSSELDYRALHGGCPVIVGSKWICNEWFHERGQEFTRPCGLKPDGYKSIKFKVIR